MPVQIAFKLDSLRRLLLVVVLAAVAVAGVVFAARASATTGDAPQPSRRVLVRPGETLSGVAARELPATPLDVAVTELIATNSLPGEQLAAGQTLVIPGR